MSSILKVDTIQNIGGTTGLTIDSSGRISQPSIPAFQGLSNTKQSSGNYLFTNFSTSGSGACNRGGHFNATTGIFTAPITGIYNFGFIFGEVSGGGGRKIGLIFLNDTAIDQQVAEGSEAFNDVGGSMVMELDANDTISIGTHSSLQWNRCTFSGFLIG